MHGRPSRGRTSTWSRCGRSSSTTGPPTSCARNPDAVVLHLGCGMDTRAFRIDARRDVEWFDLDQPGVIELRRKLYDDTDSYRMIGSSVTDPRLARPDPDWPPGRCRRRRAAYVPDRTPRCGDCSALDRPVRQRRASLRHTLAVGPATVPALHAAGSSNGASATPVISRLGTSRLPVLEQQLRAGGLRVGFRCAAAALYPAAACDAGAQLRRR